MPTSCNDQSRKNTDGPLHRQRASTREMSPLAGPPVRIKINRFHGALLVSSFQTPFRSASSKGGDEEARTSKSKQGLGSQHSGGQLAELQLLSAMWCDYVVRSWCIFVGETPWRTASSLCLQATSDISILVRDPHLHHHHHHHCHLHRPPRWFRHCASFSFSTTTSLPGPPSSASAWCS
jgi:hypothetical protein